ncbi:MAG TPA: PAS domain S-box protein [Desulfuromonadales bacterium]|nr:PAS domain S-box protein [Desulfuromonadales bacterium]
MTQPSSVKSKKSAPVPSLNERRAADTVNRQMRAVLDSATELSIIATDTKGTITIFSRGAQKMLGYSGAEVIGKHNPLLFHLESEITARAELLSHECGETISGFAVFIKQTESPNSEQHEWTYCCKDGRRILVYLTVTVIRDAQGTASGYLGVAEDITGRKAAERQLKESQELLSTIINALPNPLFYKNEAGIYVDCNQAFCNFLGLPKERIIGATVHDVAPSDLADVYHQADLDLMEHRGTQTYESEVRYADGTLHDVLFYKSAIVRPNGTVRGMVGIMLDISDRKRSERERETLEQRLFQTQKLESIGRLAGGVAHDFNNLLTPIMGYSEMLRKSCGCDERNKERLDGILEAARSARDLTRQLLAYSRKQALEMKVFDLNEVIDSFASVLQRTVRENVTISLSLDPDSFYIHADKVQLEQILMNLAVNAQDAMPNGGHLLFETSEVTLDATDAERYGLIPARYVLLSVSDTGCGMPETVRTQIFEPFYTTKDIGLGTGLGLATVFGIIKQHGGHILVYSETGHGTTFKLYFPRLEDHLSTASVNGLEEPWPPRHNATILLVEDNLPVRKMTHELLQEYGYKVLTAGDPDEAIRLFEEHRGNVDLLLSDVIMPGMDGPLFYRRLLAQKADLKVLYMSGYTENVIKLQGLIDEIPPYIQKPFTAQSLLKKVDDVIGPRKKPKKRTR